MVFNSIEEIIADVRVGKMVIIVDDEQRENEGDLLIAASHITPENINFMITHARGLVCLSLTESRCRQLNLTPMVDINGSQFGTGFTQSIEAAKGVTTGISAADRSKTIQTAVAINAKAEDLVRPGHIFPIMARKGGVLCRAGHTEAGCDLARLADLEPAAVICEIINNDGSMAHRNDLKTFTQKHQLKIGTIADLIQYRINHESIIKEIDSYPVTTIFGQFTAHVFEDTPSQSTHTALVKGNLQQGISRVSVHSSFSLNDLTAIVNTSCSNTDWPFYAALKAIAQSQQGVFIMIANPYDSHSAQKKSIKHYSNQLISDNKPDLAIGISSQILKYLGINELELLSSRTSFLSWQGFNLNIKNYIEPYDA